MTRGVHMRAAVVTAALVTLGADASEAATVSATTGGFGPFGVAAGSVRYDASPGETNRVTMRLVRDSRGVIELREDGAPLVAGPRCTVVGTGVVRCDAAADFVSATVETRDGDDTVTIEDPIYAIVASGSGSDTVIGACQAVGEDGDDHLVGCLNTLKAYGHSFRGGQGSDTIEAGPADDTIDGGGGRDVLRGGGGNDSIDDGDGPAGEPGPDVIDGADGSDTVVYASRNKAVHVDLARTDLPQGTNGENDVVEGVENVMSGSGDDVLLGSDEPNRLDAGRGRDRLDGRDGADQLLDGPGTDVVSAGAGDDYVVTGDVYRDTVDCGPGADQLLGDRGDVVAAGCEAVANDYRLVSFTRLGASARRVSFRVRCLETDELPRLLAREFEPCAFNVALRFRIRGRLTTVATGRCNLQSCSTLVLRRAAWRTLVAKRAVTARVVFTRIPAAGTLRHVDRVVLKVHRTKR